MKKYFCDFAMVLAILFLTACGSSKMVYVPSPTIPTVDPTQPKMVQGEQVIYQFCDDESKDVPGMYMAGLGVADDRPDRNSAILDANKAAILEIATKYIGVISNAIDHYSKDTNVPSNKKIYESSLEGGAKVLGSKIIEKYASVKCRKLLQNATGGFVCYVALQVMLDDAKNALVEELEVRKVDFDKEKFFKHYQKEVDNISVH